MPIPTPPGPTPAPPDPWQPTRGLGPDPWQATRQQTQVVRDEDSYLASGRPSIGRAVGDNRHELFVSCEADLALRQQFEHLRPEFIVVHDVATAASPKLLAGIAAASRRAVQHLAIRRTGYGTAVATIPFVELPIAEGGTLRIYSTDVQAEPPVRDALARTLLAFATVSALLVGDAPAASIGSVLKALHDDMVAGPWPNRHLLLLPLSTANALVAHGMELARGTGVNVRTTPQVARPGDAWNFISTTWARVREPAAPAAAPAGAPAGGRAVRPPLAPLPMRPMPPVARATPAAPAAAAPGSVDDVLARYVQQLAGLTGMIGCCLFDVASGRALLHAGAGPQGTELAEQGAELLATMLASARALGLGPALPEAAITLGAHHLVLRPLPRHPGLALHAVLDKASANLMLARLQIARMDALFEEAPAG